MTQLQTDTRALVAEVERLTGLQSNWSGTVTVGMERNTQGEPRYDGLKAWNCDIVLHESQLLVEERHATLVHEAFHSVSVGLTAPAYRVFRGYEEGVVEQCTRLLRLTVLANIGLLTPLKVRMVYSSEIRLLEELRAKAQQTVEQFYLDLLRTPLSDREDIIMEWIRAVDTARTKQQIKQETLAVCKGLRR